MVCILDSSISSGLLPPPVYDPRVATMMSLPSMPLQSEFLGESYSASFHPETQTVVVSHPASQTSLVQQPRNLSERLGEKLQSPSQVSSHNVQQPVAHYENSHATAEAQLLPTVQTAEAELPTVQRSNDRSSQM